MQVRTSGKGGSTNSKNSRGRIENGEQLHVPGNRGGGEPMYGYGHDFKPVNNMMAHMSVNFGREKAIFIILYAPQQGRTEEQKRMNSLEMYRHRLITSKATKKSS